jgi:signal peptidase I
MFEPMPRDSPAPVADQEPGFGGKRWLAVLVSAIVAGGGQILLGQRRKGSILLSVLLVLLICFWPVRVLRYYAGFVLLYCVWMSLYLYAAGAAYLARSFGSSAPRSKLQLIAVISMTCVTTSLLGSLATRVAGFRSFQIPSTSMEKTILRGDRIVADIRRFNRKAPNRQDVIIFRKHDLFFVKRVIAVGGDVVGGNDGQVLVNGNALEESYAQHTGQPPAWMYNFGPVTVPVGEYFVMGDNRDVSLDSRSPEFGFVSAESIIGAPLYVFGSDRPGKSIQ